MTADVQQTVPGPPRRRDRRERARPPADPPATIGVLHTEAATYAVGTDGDLTDVLAHPPDTAAALLLAPPPDPAPPRGAAPHVPPDPAPPSGAVPRVPLPPDPAPPRGAVPHAPVPPEPAPHGAATPHVPLPPDSGPPRAATPHVPLPPDSGPPRDEVPHVLVPQASGPLGGVAPHVPLPPDSGPPGQTGSGKASRDPAGSLPDAPVLLVSRDPVLARAAERLAAAAGVRLAVTDDLPPSGPAPSPWSSTSGVPWSAGWPVSPPVPLLLVGADVAARYPSGPPPRLPVVVIATPPATDEVWRASRALGAEQILLLPEGESWLVARMASAGDPPRARVIGIVGGRGGAGASVLAAALARTAARMRRRCVLVDADPLGGGSDLLLGADGASGLRWHDLATARGRLDPGLLLDGLPSIDGVHVLTWARDEPAALPPAAARAVLDAATRASDVVVIDLPRTVDETTAQAAAACHLGMLVVPAEVRASASARQVAAVMGRWIGDLRIVVRGPAPTNVDPARIADALDLPLAADLRAEPGLDAALDRGEPPALKPRGPLARFCRELLADPGMLP